MKTHLTETHLTETHLTENHLTENQLTEAHLTETHQEVDGLKKFKKIQKQIIIYYPLSVSKSNFQERWEPYGTVLGGHTGQASLISEVLRLKLKLKF